MNHFRFIIGFKLLIIKIFIFFLISFIKSIVYIFFINDIFILTFEFNIYIQFYCNCNGFLLSNYELRIFFIYK